MLLEVGRFQYQMVILDTNYPPDARFARIVHLFSLLPAGAVVENPPANVEDTGDMGLIPGSRRFPGRGNATCSSTLAWRIPWTEEPGRL